MLATAFCILRVDRVGELVHFGISQPRVTGHDTDRVRLVFDMFLETRYQTTF